MNLAQSAKKVTDSFGRTYMKIPEIIEKYPNYITVNGISQRNGEYGPFNVLYFAEEPDKQFSASSTMIAQIVDNWIQACGDDMNVLDDELKKKPVKMKISTFKGKNKETGRSYTGYRFEIIDDFAGEDVDESELPF